MERWGSPVLCTQVRAAPTPRTTSVPCQPGVGDRDSRNRPPTNSVQARDWERDPVPHLIASPGWGRNPGPPRYLAEAPGPAGVTYFTYTEPAVPRQRSPPPTTSPPEPQGVVSHEGGNHQDFPHPFPRAPFLHIGEAQDIL